MKAGILFQPVFSPILLISGSILLLIVLLLSEWKRNFRFRAARLTAQVVMVLSLILILLRPARNVEQHTSGVILLTEGYKKQTADSLVAVYPDIEILRTDDATSYPNSSRLLSYRALSGDDVAIRFVAGKGLPLHALDLIRKKHFEYFPGETTSGFADLHAPTEITVNKRGVIEGTLNIPSGGKLLLEGPGGLEDSMQMSGVAFQLSFFPRHTGRFLYRLIVKDSTNTITFEEKLPVTVLEERKLNVAILQEYPSGEVRYLKNFLSENGHGISLRSRFSRHEYRYEFVNVPRREVLRITTLWLDGFDLLIIDSDAFQNLSSGERNDILAAANNGLGMLFLFNAAPSQVRGLSSFLPVQYSSATRDTTTMQLGGVRYVMPVSPEIVRDRVDILSVLRSTRGELISGYVYHGRGKIGFQFLNETYRLALEGKNESYALLWSSVVEKIARSHTRDFALSLLTRGPIHVGDPIDVEILSSGKPPSLHADSIAIPLAEDVLLDDRWLGRTWFADSGWHTLSVEGDSATFNVYVQPGVDMSSWGDAVQRNANRIQAGAPDNSREITVTKKVSPWLFFVLFLLAGGFLWLAPKL